ncbi:MAG: beta-galactosidase [Clostridia bacterium]|nr:beta-galactosidase [Clostridia bacterium]
MNIPRPEHPNPQFERESFENLNGIWEFEIDKSASGIDRKLYEADRFSHEITVPFCPESKLSGIGEIDFLNSVWYKRTINIKDTSDRIILHIGACDYFTTLYINGKKVGTHQGGYTSFSFDISDFITPGENTVVIHALDDTKDVTHPSGKQAFDSYYSYSCFYTRITGIWQTVWLEYVPQTHINSVKYYPDAANGKVHIKAVVTGNDRFTATAFYNGKVVGKASAFNCGNNADLTIDLSEIHLWELGKGRLYDLELTYGDDKVKSYFGLRSVCLDGYKFLLNGKTVFQRIVLDQGYYPDGLYTAPSDQALINDIKISLDAGFNGARLHEKVFEPRFLYHCDKMGYMVWGEYANWGFDHSRGDVVATYLREWEEAIERDFNHPAIIGWCPFNETWDFNGRKQNDELLEMIYKTTKLMDTTRPCIDSSGNFHVATDIFDFHDYIQDVDTFAGQMKKLEEEDILIESTVRNPLYPGRQKYTGGPVFCSEYGGIKWDVECDIESWGYGNAPKTKEEFISRYKGLTEALLSNSKMLGFCYTQLYDIEQEKNGLYTYDRKPKFDMNIFKEINSQKAKIEE